jgi:serine/threonine-protein kinase HipA
VLSTQIDLGDPTASLDLAFSVAGYFELKPEDARQIAREVGRAVSNWRTQAAGIGIAAREIDRMSSAFEHTDLAKARS